ncbi:MAG: hypothetical protein SFV32_10675 [Opitutaceae bacterium]|nr:hypothetical protein [Opitutaceae bacterium]
MPPESTSARPNTVMVIPHYEVQWNRPVFRAPALTLPTQKQLWSDIPFSAQFRGKSRSAK